MLRRNQSPNHPAVISDPGLPTRDQQWLLTLLPGFPLALLVLRLWYLSRQDLPVMLLLVQYVSPIGLISAMITMLIWLLPLTILLCRSLGLLLWVSAPSEQAALTSRLTSLSRRMPGWVVAFAVLLALLTWQLRFLPTLFMIVLAIVGLTVRGRNLAPAFRTALACKVLPLAVAGVVYSWFGPAIVNALEVGEWATAALLLLPSGLTVFLTGPVPARMARLVTHWAAVGAAVLAPFLIGAIFLRAPILPTVALEFVPDPTKNLPHESLGGHAITVDDRMTTLLDKKGTVRFIPNDQIVSKTLCPEDSQVPYSVVVVHAWPVEQTALAWLTATPEPVLADPRCQGRPLVP